eukprot:COSAG01_NODE_10753_length_2087_cov_1.873742_2_plen_330_part_00
MHGARPAPQSRHLHMPAMPSRSHQHHTALCVCCAISFLLHGSAFRRLRCLLRLRRPGDLPPAASRIACCGVRRVPALRPCRPAEAHAGSCGRCLGALGVSVRLYLRRAHGDAVSKGPCLTSSRAAAAAAAALQQSEPLDDNGGRQQRAGSSAAAARSEVHSQDQATAVTKRQQRAGRISAPPDAGEGRSGGEGQCESGKGKRRRVKGAAAKIGFPPRENGAVGLPNSSGSDCFWISALQCIRHAPGYVSALRHCLGSIPQVCWELRPFQSGFQRRLQAHEMTYGCVCLRDLQQRMDLGSSSNTPEREEEGTRVGLPSRWSLICCVRRRH